MDVSVYLGRRRGRSLRRRGESNGKRGGGEKKPCWLQLDSCVSLLSVAFTS